MKNHKPDATETIGNTLVPLLQITHFFIPELPIVSIAAKTLSVGVNALQLYRDVLTLKKQKPTYQNISDAISHVFYGINDAYDAVQGVNKYRQRARIHPMKANHLYFSTQTLRMYTDTEDSLSLSTPNLLFHVFAASITLNTLVNQSLQKKKFHDPLFLTNYVQQLVLTALYTDMLLNNSRFLSSLQKQIAEFKSLYKTQSIQKNIEMLQVDSEIDT